jgi:hypothetical protein
LLASHHGNSGLISGQVMWGLWWKKWRWDRFSPSTSVFPANSHSTKYSIPIICGCKNRPMYQVDSVSPHPKILKKKRCIQGTSKMHMHHCPWCYMPWWLEHYHSLSTWLGLHLHLGTRLISKYKTAFKKLVSSPS